MEVSKAPPARRATSVLPEAQISFEHREGAKAGSTHYLIDNSRLRTEFGVEPLDLRQCVLKIIADVRAGNSLPPIQTSAAFTAPDSQPDRAPARTPHQ